MNNPISLRQLIKNRASEIDDDAANGFEFIKHLEENLQSLKIYPSGVIKILQAEMRELISEFLGEKIGANGVKKKVEALGLPCLHQLAKQGKPRMWLFRKDGEALTPEQIESVTNQLG